MKGKRCPCCKKWNKISDIICPDCGEDLLRVKPEEIKEVYSGDEKSEKFSLCDKQEKITCERDPEEENYQNEISSICAEEPTVYARICRGCKKPWPYSESKCPECGTSLEGEFPVSVSQAALCNPTDFTIVMSDSLKQKSLYLVCSDDGLFHADLSEGDEIILGREAVGVEYMENKKYVSRMHVKLAVIKGELLLTHIGSSNPTLVNGRPIEKDKPFRLQAGDEIVLGGRVKQGYSENIAYFHINQRN